MSPRTKEQFDEMRSRSRQTIMDAALELFTHRGYHGTSISLIARQAGVSTGLMYNYFPSKEALLEAIVREGLTIMQDLMDGILKIDDPRQQLVAMIEATFTASIEDMHFWSLYFSVMMQPDLPVGAKRIFVEFMTMMFQYLQDTYYLLGYARPEVESRILAAILDGVLLHYWLVGDAYPIDEVKQFIISKVSGEQNVQNI